MIFLGQFDIHEKYPSILSITNICQGTIFSLVSPRLFFHPQTQTQDFI